jgi:hypothetical protein
MRTFTMTDAAKISGDEAHYDAVGLYFLEDRAFTAWQEIADSVGPAGYEDELVVEDGTGLSTANSYVTHAFADAYFANGGGVTVWTSATSIQRDTALRQATLYLDMIYGLRFAGLRSVSTQLLEWPRSFAYDREGTAIEGVPLRLKQAVCEVAKRWLTDSSQLTPDIEAGTNISSESTTVGAITTSKTYTGSKDLSKRFPVVDRLLQLGGLVTSGGWAQR